MPISRRDFVSAAVAGGALLAASRPLAAQENAEPTPVPKRKFERIDLEVPVLSQGTVQTSEAAVLLRGLEWGMNLVHTAEGYGGGVGIRTVAEAIKDRREEFVVGLKCRLGDGELERCLELLGTDHVELLFVPTTDPSEPTNDRFRERYAGYKDQGVITKGLGLTAHDNVGAVLEAGLEAGWWDVFMPSCQPANFEVVDPIMERAAENGIGGMVMKSWRGVNDAASRRAAWAAMLSKPHWTTICKTVANEQFVDEMGRFAHSWEDYVDAAAVETTMREGLGRVCASCGNCTEVCPQAISPARIFRYEMYAVEYGWHEVGRGSYAALPASARATACTSCGICSEHCAGRLDIATRLREAHEALA